MKNKEKILKKRTQNVLEKALEDQTRKLRIKKKSFLRHWGHSSKVNTISRFTTENM